MTQDSPVVPAGTLVTLLREQAARTPHARAVVAEDACLSYAELDARADRLARRLRRAGAGPERVVAVAVPRGAGLVVAIVAVLKAGAAYLPLDPGDPPQRRRLMLTDAGAVAAVTPDAEPGDAFEGVVTVDVNDAAATGEPPAALPEARPGNLAYVIYTSGSTGRPKGVGITHRAIVNRLAWMQARYDLRPDDRVLQKTPAGFDVSVWEFFWPLLHGATLVMARPDGHRDPAYLAEVVRRERITTLHFVPSMLAAFLRAEPGTPLPSVRRVLCSGEALPAETVHRFHRAHDAELHNLYGPTEAAVDVTAWPCPPGMPDDPVPIGLPVWNTGVRVLDGALRPVADGETGELYLTGVQLARGYLGRPGLTATRFVADPFGAPGERMYRTGDLGRRRPDGAFEYAGRVDNQVKLRGQRVELGEIESVLTGHPAVEQAAVLVRENTGGHRHLVGYLVAAEPVADDDLEAYLAARLPAHMVPARYVTLDELPVTANGKLDRAALAAIEPRRTGGGRAARTEPERLVCGIFAEVLGLPSVRPDEGFLRLGGDSIQAIDAAGRITRAGLPVAVRDVMGARTAAALAERALTRPAPTVAEAPEAGWGAVPMTPIMHWLRERGGPADAFGQRLVLRIPAQVTAAWLTGALRRLLEVHDMLRVRRRITADGRWELVVPPPDDVDARRCVTEVPLDGRTGPAAGELIRAELAAAQRRLSLDEGRLVQAVLFSAGPDRQAVLGLVVNHLCVDGVSWRVLLNDLREAWHAGPGWRPAPAVTTFRTWARLLNGEARSDARPEAAAYWSSALDPGRARLGRRPLDARTDHESPDHLLTLDLDPATTERLVSPATGPGSPTINDLLLTGLALAVRERAHRDGTPDEPVVLDVEGHGRQDRDGTDLSRTVGWFTTLFPVRLLKAGGTFHDDPLAALRLVREQLRDIPDKGLEYGVHRYLRAPGEHVAGSEPEIGFNYLGRFDGGGTGDWTIVADFGVGLDCFGAGMPMAHAVEVNAAVVDGPGGPVLRATWSWAAGVLTRPEVARLAETWFHRLTRLAADAADAADDAAVSRDLTLRTVSAAEIEELEAELNAIRS
ncbi:non-ribosomal peptide synthase domain TIGR01720/amino acid adenylation domain-containing protein [Nonomuraea solani]|uniref:Non-ribosomal peptide synthase domain TIGR01720/amino acid adenylation domain-containing protein n=1 Tax=Nonomuraea solani TaxID=1144553 RepID=A0A1H6DVV5_9ACTN|nr:non-ribosomal peptide synthetase [Nonomuraea solani]SEG89214.1 non-ribosomal peptide synthase domain TIGR01720/amino acid adenylation domain-containing protein [Nonomuraea solani]